MMSGKGGGSHNNGGGKALSVTIPASSWKMVQSLKEIVSNFPDHEIYATLKDCNMNLNKAIKDPTDSRSPGSGTNNTSSRGGGRAGTDHYGGHGDANQFDSSGMWIMGVELINCSGLFGLQGKPAYKKENGAATFGGSISSTPSVLGK
ncbi:hypothetical protein JHK87_003462 [Glycine soja]|nr:hypothetical protein JHK87_003462 [Glycine soja]